MTETRESERARTIRDALDRWEAPLLRFAAGIVGAERARDVVQDAFLRLWEYEPAAAATGADGRARADEGLAPWLFTVCRNRAIEVARREGRMQLESTVKTRAEEALAAIPVAAAAGGGDATPFDAVARRERGDLLRAAVTRLPERQRELVRLRYESGLSYRQMAELVGISESNVGYLLHVALRALREGLGGEA
ncbi:MAG: sigma-70 family RNA polymerase sigma factor [Deltaproteobacteria bacterium]|nr:sigma-70 family RNA polymerase sigma factor [Deltaproteobacteria bacterium]